MDESIRTFGEMTFGVSAIGVGILLAGLFWWLLNPSGTKHNLESVQHGDTAEKGMGGCGLIMTVAGLIVLGLLASTILATGH